MNLKCLAFVLAFGAVLPSVAQTEARLGGDPSVPAARPLIVKSNYSGFVAPEWARAEVCRVYADRVVINREYGQVGGDPSGTLTTVQEIPFKIQGDVTQYIAQAKLETLESTPNQVCDGPTTRVVAHEPGAPDSDPGIVLYSTGGCGADTQVRTGGRTDALRSIVDSFCPVTHGPLGIR